MTVATVRLCALTDIEIDADELGAYEGISTKDLIDRFMDWWGDAERRRQDDILLHPDMVSVVRWKVSENGGFTEEGEE